MHVRSSSLALVLACATASAWPVPLAAASAPRIGLTVRVYQTAGVSSELQTRALAVAEIALRSALVDVRWEECTSRSSSAPCQAPPGPSNLVLALRESATCEETPITLGDALIVNGEGGVLASVYVNCVAWLASETETDIALLLGRVVAHELGHLMMRRTAHTHRGLMRRNWTPDEIRRNRAPDWVFTAEDLAAMRQ